MKTKVIAILSLYFSLLLFLYFVVINENNSKVVVKTKYKKVYVIKEKDNKFSESKLKEYILELNFKFPEIVYAQAKLETGNFTSNAFKNKNNLFGLHVARQRPTLAKKSNNHLAYYHTWKESVIDYALLVSDRMRKLNEDQYLAYLDQHYDAPGYSNKIKEILSTIKI
jgi:hypothetical protein